MAKIKGMKLEQIKKLVERNAIRWLRRFWEKLLKDIQKNTPEDTYSLINWYSAGIIIDGDNITYRIINKEDYFLYVEYGVQDRVYNYYKWWWRRAWGSPFYSWVWARMVTKAIEANKVNYVPDLSVELQSWL